MDATVKVWDIDGNLIHNLEGPTDEITSVCWHQKGNALIACS